MRRKNILPPFPFNDAFTQNQYYKLFSDLVSSKRRLHRTVSLPIKPLFHCGECCTASLDLNLVSRFFHLSCSSGSEKFVFKFSELKITYIGYLHEISIINLCRHCFTVLQMTSRGPLQNFYICFIL